jgi:ribonuclease D
MKTQDTRKQTENEKPAEPEYHIALTREDINALPISSYTGPISVLDEAADIESACQALSREQILGFDTETRPSFRKGESYQPSLIQLAGSQMVYLFQLNSRIPQPLKELLGDPDVKKAGVALEYDLRQLKAMDEFVPAGFAALEPLARALKIKNQGLRGLAAALFGFRISKKAQCSNWSRRELTETQITYAATDAWISRQLYVELSKRLAAKPPAQA